MRHWLAAGVPMVLAISAGCGLVHTDWQGVGATMPTPSTIGSGQYVSEVRAIGEISRIVSGGGLAATVSHAAGGTLEITAEDNVLPLLDCVERDGTLTLGWKTGGGSVSAHGITIRIGVRELRGVTASGGSSITVEGIATNDFDASLSGAARFTASGAVQRLSLDLSGASQARTGDLASRAVSASVSGASAGTVRAGDSLTVTASGASILEFMGDPAVNARVSDTSIVRRIGP